MNNEQGTPVKQLGIPAPIYGAAKAMLSSWVDLDKVVLPNGETGSARPELYTVADIERIYKIKRFTLWRMIRRGDVIAHKTGDARSSRVLVDSASLDAYLASKTVSSDS